MSNDPGIIQFQGKTVFSKAVISQFRRVPKYFVADESCFLFLTKGEFNLRTPDKLLKFKQGDGMLAKCGNYFVESSTPQTDGSVEMVAAYFHPSIVKSFFPHELTLSGFIPDFDVHKLPVNDLLQHFMESISLILDHPEIASEELVALKLKELLLLLAYSSQAPSIYEFIVSLFKPYEYEFREIIHKNTHANLSLSEMATLCNMSLATFKRRFSEIFETSPAQYFMQEKLKKAAELLVLPQGQIADIVFECGFESPSHFSKAFRKQYGKSPSEYKMSLSV